MSKVHISIDIETMGNTGRAPVTQIGAVAFTEENGIEGEFEAAIDISQYDLPILKPHFDLDCSTMQWWMTQETEAQQAAFSGKGDLFLSLVSFRTWYWDCVADQKGRVWAKPPQFDCVILRHVYNVMALVNPDFDGQPAWKHYDERCLRTLIEVFPRIKKLEREGTHHNALDDARHQAHQIMLALQVKADMYSGKATP